MNDTLDNIMDSIIDIEGGSSSKSSKLISIKLSHSIRLNNHFKVIKTNLQIFET